MATNTAGTDTLTHALHVTSPPASVFVAVVEEGHASLNVTMTVKADGGAPVLGKMFNFLVCIENMNVLDCL